MIAAAALAAVLGIAYLIWSPSTGDLFGALYRADLFDRHGLVLWDGNWYAGHHTLTYSVLYGAPAAGIGVRLLGVLSVIAAAAIFAALAGRARTAAPGAVRASGLWFAAGAASWLLTGRLAFLAGLAPALGALLALVSRRTRWAVALAALTALVSPVAAAFLGLAAVARAAQDPGDRRAAVMTAAAALVPVAGIAYLFPAGGAEPFVASSFWPALAGAVALTWLLGARAGAVRTGSALYALALVAAFVIPTPLGGNAARLGALFAGPVAALSLARSRPRALMLLAAPLAWWQLAAPVTDAVTAAGDTAVRAAYFDPLLAELRQLRAVTGTPFRIEIPFTREKAEAYYVAREFPIARGWERQLDQRDNRLFYSGTLTPERYRAWLGSAGVAYVALPDARTDSSARREADLVRHGLPYLVAVWRSAHWSLYAVAGSRGLAAAPARVTALGVDSLTVASPRPGRVRVAERWSPYWSVVGGRGCVSAAGDGYTTVTFPAGGVIRLGIRLGAGRLSSESGSCR